MHEHTRNELIEQKAKYEAKSLEALQQQEEMIHGFRSELLQSTADLVDFNRADEIIAAAMDDAA